MYNLSFGFCFGMLPVQKITLPFPNFANAAVIEPVFSKPFTTPLLAPFMFLALSTVLTASSPQHDFACFCKLLVDLPSFLLRKH